MQAAQAEAVGRDAAAARSASAAPLEPCDKCHQQGRPFTTSARVASATAFDSTAAAAASEITSANGSTMFPRGRPPALPAGTMAALTHIARWEGPRGLYRGLDVSLLMAIPATVLYYSVYDDFRARLERAGANNVTAPVTAGATARILATICMAPLELTRTRIQSSRSAPSSVRVGSSAATESLGMSRLPLASVVQAMSKVFRDEGVLALWRGVGTTMWRDVPFSMVYWLGYENLKSSLGCGRGSVEDEERSEDAAGKRHCGPGEQRGSADFLMRSFAAGATSGVVASLLTHPFDVAKTQQQVLRRHVQGELRR